MKIPPELLLLAQICTKSFVGWGFAPNPTGRAYSALRPPSWFKGWAPGKGSRGRGRKRKKRKGEGRGGMRGEAGHPGFSDGLTPLLPAKWLVRKIVFCTSKVISKMTYTVSSGILNLTIAVLILFSRHLVLIYVHIKACATIRVQP